MMYDIKEIARNFLSKNPIELAAKEQLAVELMEASIEIFNYPHLDNKIIQRLEVIMETEYQIVGVEQTAMKIVDTMRRATRSAGWDQRTVGKLEYKQVGVGYHTARLVMDLDETVAIILAQNSTLPQAEHVTDIVDDNPDMDVLNELNRLSSNETNRETRLLPNRSSTFIHENEERGWRVRDWDNFRGE